MKEQLEQLCREYGCTLQTDEPLSAHTSFRIGGAADYMAEIPDVAALQAVLHFCKTHSVPWFVLGRGSNILASDEGFRGVVLHLGASFSKIERTGTRLYCLAGTTLGAAANYAADNSLSGMEPLSGIPGSIGGALYMNAGAYGGEMKDVTISCEYLDRDGILRTMPAEEMQLSYRHSWFAENEGIIVSVTLELKEGIQQAIRDRMKELAARRIEKQPLELPSAGSTFKRPEGSFASKLIDECGLRGFRVGNAQVSEKHCGFVVNRGNASCAEVMELCRQVRDIVKERTGYSLELEPVLLGEVPAL